MRLAVCKQMAKEVGFSLSCLPPHLQHRTVSAHFRLHKFRKAGRVGGSRARDGSPKGRDEDSVHDSPVDGAAIEAPKPMIKQTRADAGRTCAARQRGWAGEKPLRRGRSRSGPVSSEKTLRACALSKASSI